MADSLDLREILLFCRRKIHLGRDFVEEHADLCIEAGLNFEGLTKKLLQDNGIQLFAKGAKSW